MASPALTIAVIAGALLILTAGDDKAKKPETPKPPPSGKPTDRQCLELIARVMQEKMRRVPEFAEAIAKKADAYGWADLAACLRALPTNHTIDCTSLVVAALEKELAMLGEPAKLRQLAQMARAAHYYELANCYDQLADVVEQAQASGK